MSLNVFRRPVRDCGVAASAKRQQYVVLRSWHFGFGSGMPTLFGCQDGILVRRERGVLWLAYI